MSKGKKISCIASFAFACAVLILTITLCMMHPGRVYASSMDPDSITKITQKDTQGADHKFTNRPFCFFKKFRLCDFSLIEWLNCLFVDLLERWPHDKKCQKQCQTDQNLIGWCRLRSDRSPKEMKYNDNSCKRSHHNQNRWCK